MTVASRGRQKSLRALLFITPLLYRLNCTPHLLPPLRSQHADNCCSLKFNSALCPTTPTPPVPQTTPSHLSCTHNYHCPHSGWFSLLSDLPRPLWMAPKAHRSGQERTPDQKPREETGWNKPLLWSQWKSRWPLSWPPSFKCTLWRGPDNPPLPTLKTEKRERGWKTAKLASALFGNIYERVRESNGRWFSHELATGHARYRRIKTFAPQSYKGNWKNLDLEPSQRYPYYH